MRRLSILAIFSIFLTTSAAFEVLAQGRSEIGISFGVGSLQVNPGGGTTAVFSLSYRFHITRHFSAEGALDTFNYKLLTGPSNATYNDDYLGAEAAVVYYFLGNRETGKWLPFVVAGIGKTTTDFTEIAAHRYYRMGAGISYHLSDRFGFRVEVRDEIITKLWNQGSPAGNLPSIRCGVAYRF